LAAIALTISTAGAQEYIRPARAPLPASAIPFTETTDDMDRAVREHGKAEALMPIIDAEIHIEPPVGQSMDQSLLDDLYRKLGNERVTGAIVMPTPNGGRHPHHEAAARQDEAFVAMGGPDMRRVCGSGYITIWMQRAYEEGFLRQELDALLARASADLDSGCIGIGELATHHFRKEDGQRIIRYPATFGPFLELVDLVASRGAWLFLHAEPLDTETGTSYAREVFGGLEAIMARQPGLKLVVEHTGMTSAGNARLILERYPSIVMTVKIRKSAKWARLGRLVDEKGNLYEDWAELFEAMPDRFVIGTDVKPGREGQPVSRYSDRIKNVRRVLSTLPRDVALKLASENAERLFFTP
jgi:hypothetical protein